MNTCNNKIRDNIPKFFAHVKLYSVNDHFGVEVTHETTQCKEKKILELNTHR